VFSKNFTEVLGTACIGKKYSLKSLEEVFHPSFHHRQRERCEEQEERE